MSVNAAAHEVEPIDFTKLRQAVDLAVDRFTSGKPLGFSRAVLFTLVQLVDIHDEDTRQRGSRQ